jgi:hypothetical protein
MAQAAHVITVTVRHNYEVEPGQIDTFLYRIASKNIGIVAGVEKNAQTVVFDQSAESPVLLHRAGVSKRRRTDW